MTDSYDQNITRWMPPSDSLEDKYPDEGTQLTGQGSDPTHHITLTDGDKTVGFVITDQTGDRDERTFRRFPQADPGTPYVTEKQDTFGGGFGQSAFEENRSRYWRSRGVDTTKDALVLAPMFHHAQGAFRKAQEYMPTQSAYWRKLGGTHGWRAMPFTPAQEWLSTTYLKLFIQKVDAPPTLRIRMYTETASEPGDLIHTEDIAASTITDPDGQWVRFAIADTYTYGADTQFWVVLTTTGASSSGHWKILSKVHSVGLKSADGSTWTNGTDFFFRIEGPASPFTARFFDFKKQVYTLLTYDAWQASTLWMNGWRGCADANTGALTHLKDSTQNWSTRVTGDEVIQMVAGKASGELEDRRTVASGADGYLVVDNAWITEHKLVQRDDYVVTNSDHWFNVAAGSGELDGKVSDVAVANGVAYICRGNLRNLTFFTAHNKADTWTDEFEVRGLRAQFVQAVHDPISGDQLWFGFNRAEAGEYKPYVWMSDPATFGSTGMDMAHICDHQADDAGEFWQESSADVAVEEIRQSEVRIKVTVSEVDGVAVDAGGTGYSVGDDLVLTEAGSSGTCKVNVDAETDGVVTAVSILVAGYDYTTGSKATTHTTGSGNDDCTIEITSLGGFGTGQIAYTDLYETDDTTVRTVDLRNMTTVLLSIKYSTVLGKPSELSEGDLQLQLDNSQGCGSPFSEDNIPNMLSEWAWSVNKNFDIDLSSTDGAQEVTSVGLKLTAAKTLSFYITLYKEIRAVRQRSPIDVGQVDGDNITGLESFGDPETAWVFTETGLGQLKNQKFLPVPQREIKVARNSNNGLGHDVHDVYLMFTWQGRLQRYFRQNIDDLGPDFPAGMSDVAGVIVDVKTYPGRIYAAVDGGRNNKSMILCYKGGAWHEVYTSFTGERIRSLFIQSIEGKSDKLWASVGSDLMWFPITLNAAELPANSDYTYNPVGYLDTSWIYTSSRELDKVFRSMLATLEKAMDTDLYLDVYFKVDDEDAAWEKTAYLVTKSASTIEYHFTGIEPTDIVRGNRVKIRIALRTKDIRESPIVRSIQNRIYRLQEVKFAYTFISKLSTISINLRGDEEKVIGAFGSLQAALDVLDTWASTLTPLKVVSDIASFTDKLVVIEPLPAQLLLLVHDDNIQEQTVQLAANDL